jgi:hypothetical protein
MGLDIGVSLPKDDRVLGFSSVCSYGWFALFVFLYFVDIDIEWCAKDWMVFKGVTESNGRKYKVFEKNEKYMNRKCYTYILPKPKDIR